MPASNGGASITGYTVTPYVGPTAQTAVSFSSTAISQAITGLTNGTTYTFKVAAVNSVGTGAPSVASNAVTPAGVASAPTIGTATAGVKEATVSWTAPTRNNGAPVTGYIVTPYVGTTAQPSRRFDSVATTQNVAGLTAGTAYTFKVSAVNAAGTGPQSLASNAVSPRAK